MLQSCSVPQVVTSVTTPLAFVWHTDLSVYAIGTLLSIFFVHIELEKVIASNYKIEI